MACQTRGWHLFPCAFLTLTLLERVSLPQQCRQQVHIKTHLEGEDQFLQSHMQGALLPDLTSQTRQFSLSFPTRSRRGITQVTFPYQVWILDHGGNLCLIPSRSLKNMKCQYRGERTDTAPSQGIPRPYAPSAPTQLTQDHRARRCLQQAGDHPSSSRPLLLEPVWSLCSQSVHQVTPLSHFLLPRGQYVGL